MRTVQNYEELLEYAYDSLDRNKPSETLALEGDFSYSIIIPGENRDCVFK